MAESNGNGTTRLWVAYGLLVTVGLAWGGISIKVHTDLEQARQDLYIRLAELRRDVESNRERVAELKAQAWTNSTRISAMEQELAALSEYVRPGQNRIYKRRYNDQGEPIR